ncbi:hypothetical protein, partial [Pseudomonas batumici]|uniref:hypothetical protein n=1 Tax=Pseudomonas batumici TaxID=226910 RepID=UPI001ADF1DBB
PASGAGGRKAVEVRVFFWAPIQVSEYHSEISQEPAKAGFCVLSPCHFLDPAHHASQWTVLALEI